MADFSSYKLKENYKLCEYIEINNPTPSTTPGAYINTGWTFDTSKNPEIIAHLSVHMDTLTTNFFMGTVNECWAGTMSNYWIFNGVRSNFVNTNDTIHCIHLHNKISNDHPDYYYWTVDGKFETRKARSTTQPFPHLLFALYQGGAPKVDLTYNLRLYRFIVTENNKLVRHMVPVIDSTNTPGMYDLVEGKFYTNANTSATVDFSYKLKHEQLPYGYKACEWIECLGGKPYIDTGWKFDESKDPEVSVNLSNCDTSIAQSIVMGSHGSTSEDVENNTKSCYAVCGGDIWVINGASAAYAPKVIEGKKHLLQLYKGEGENLYYWYIDSVRHPAYYSLSQANNFMLFALNRGSSINTTEIQDIRIYDFKVKENGYLVRDMVPCLNQNNEPGMYDRVRGKFYGNVNASAIKEFNYQLKDQPLPSNLRRVGWIQSGCSTTTGKAPYITLQTMELSKYTGYRVKVGVDTPYAESTANLYGKGILSTYYYSKYCGLYWYMHTPTWSTYPSYFRVAGCSSSTTPIEATVQKGLTNVYDLKANYTLEGNASWVNPNNLDKGSLTMTFAATSVLSQPLFLFRVGMEYYNDDTHTIRLYDAEVTQYGNVIHHYVPCIDINQDNKPCVYDTKTNEIFYETPDDNVTEHLTWGY